MADLLDAKLAVGMTAEGDDWSYAKNSARKDRPLSPEQLQLLTQKSDAKGFMQLVSQLGLIFGLQLAVWYSPIWGLKIPLMILAGFSIVTFGHCAQHESIHNTAFKTKSYNHVVSWLASLPRFTNPTHERFLHKQHHTYTNDPDKDPELWSSSPRNKIPSTLTAYLQTVFRLGGGPLGLGVYASRYGILKNCAMGKPVGYGGFDPMPEDKVKSVRKPLMESARRQIMFYVTFAAVATVLGLWPLFAQVWLLPMAMGEPLHAIFHIADHVNCSHDYKNGATNTRTTLVPRFVGFNLWNMNYHGEHHLYPSIPFHALPKAHQLMSSRTGPDGALLPSHFAHVSSGGVDLHSSILFRYMPYLQKLLKAGGLVAVEKDWIPCPEQTSGKAKRS